MNILKLITAAGAALLTGACIGGSSEMPTDAIAIVDGEALTLSEVHANTPGALSPEDSLEFTNAYIRNWVDRKLISRVAARDINMAEVDRLVDEYREELIMNRYRREMVRRADNTEFTTDSLMAYYNNHLGEFKLRNPMVKGVYLKVPDNAPRLNEIKRLYKSDRPVDVDKLEKAAAIAAVHYDYFRDRWIYWDQIEVRIPSDFPAGFLSNGKHFETSVGGFTYLLYITEVLPEGSTMPFDAARLVVHDRLLNSVRRRYDTQLRTELEARAIREGLLIYPE